MESSLIKLLLGGGVRIFAKSSYEVNKANGIGTLVLRKEWEGKNGRLGKGKGLRTHGRTRMHARTHKRTHAALPNELVAVFRRKAEALGVFIRVFEGDA